MNQRYKYKVFVQCRTYNHCPFIEDSLQGFSIQQTSSPIVYVIIDDASTDGEQNLLRHWAKQNLMLDKECLSFKNQKSFGELISGFHKENANAYFVFLLLSENHYSKRKSISAYTKEWSSNAEYYALCEGDDYWIDPNKLQKQVDYLDSHPDCVLVHTDFDVLNVNTRDLMRCKWKHQHNYNQIPRDWGKQLPSLILQGKYSVQTLTICARFDVLREIYNEYPIHGDVKLKMGDTPLWMALASKGKVHFLPDSTSCYRILAESASHSKDFSNIIDFYVSCLYMIDKFAPIFHIKDKEKYKAAQTYMFFLIKDVYVDSKKLCYLNEIKEKIIEGRNLSRTNTILIDTIGYPHALKVIILLFINIYRKAYKTVTFIKEYVCSMLSKNK